MFLDKSSRDEVIQPLKQELIPISLSKKPYMPPELIQIYALDIANNLSGGGDGDAALAHS